MDIIGGDDDNYPAQFYYHMPQSLNFPANQHWTVALTRFCIPNRVRNISDYLTVLYTMDVEQGWNSFVLQPGAANLPQQFLNLFARSLPEELKVDKAVQLVHSQTANRFVVKIALEGCQISFTTILAEMLGFSSTTIYKTGSHIAPRDHDLNRGCHYVHIMTGSELITSSFWGSDAENPQVYMLQSFCVPSDSQSAVLTFEPNKPLYLPLARTVVDGIHFTLINEGRDIVKFVPPFAPVLFVLHFKRQGVFY